MLWPLDGDSSIGFRLLNLVFEISVNFFCKFDLFFGNNLVGEALWLVTFSTTARSISEYFLYADSTLFWRHGTILL